MRQQIGRMLCGTMLAMAIALPAAAADLVAKIYKATPDGAGEALGTITVSSVDDGAAFRLDLHGLPPGAHGFHVHEDGNCGPTLLNGGRVPAGAAGGHFDPDHVGAHAGPHGVGHLGDLPVLLVAADGTAKQTLTAPHIANAGTLRGHALVIHSGGDNYSDSPLPLGGGGGRIACGVIQ
jgi:superoxide dismutase, Cu-Zn family